MIIDFYLITLIYDSSSPKVQGLLLESLNKSASKLILRGLTKKDTICHVRNVKIFDLLLLKISEVSQNIFNRSLMLEINQDMMAYILLTGLQNVNDVFSIAKSSSAKISNRILLLMFSERLTNEYQLLDIFPVIVVEQLLRNGLYTTTTINNYLIDYELKFFVMFVCSTDKMLSTSMCSFILYCVRDRSDSSDIFSRMFSYNPKILNYIDLEYIKPHVDKIDFIKLSPELLRRVYLLVDSDIHKIINRQIFDLKMYDHINLLLSISEKMYLDILHHRWSELDFDNFDVKHISTLYQCLRKDEKKLTSELNEFFEKISNISLDKFYELIKLDCFKDDYDEIFDIFKNNSNKFFILMYHSKRFDLINRIHMIHIPYIIGSFNFLETAISSGDKKSLLFIVNHCEIDSNIYLNYVEQTIIKYSDHMLYILITHIDLHVKSCDIKNRSKKKIRLGKFASFLKEDDKFLNQIERFYNVI